MSCKVRGGRDLLRTSDTVLITGAAGFIGSHLTERCVELGLNVKAFVRYNSTNNWGFLENSPYLNDIEVITGDVRDKDAVFNAMQGTDIVFHLAALIGIPYSYVSPLAYVRVNVEGTYNVLQAARETGLGNIIITSTSETYGTARYVPMDEKHPVIGQSPYAASKIAGDQLALSYYYSFNVPVKIVRPFNTYGQRQSARALVPTIITQIASGQKKIKLGNIEVTRDLTHVKDTVEGFIEIAKADSLIGEVTNIGSNKEISIGDLAILISKRMNEDVELQTVPERVRPDNSEVRRLKCDNTKLKESTDWVLSCSLEQGLDKTIDWLKANINDYKPEKYNI